MKRNLFYTLYLILFITPLTNAQLHKLTGTIKDSTTGELLSYATIYNHETGVATLSKVDGSFSIALVSGYNRISVDHIGCKLKYYYFNATNSIDTILFIAHHQHDLDQLTVVGLKNKLILLRKDRLSADEILRSANKPIGSLLDQLVGAGSLKTGFSISKPMIQGMYGSRVIILNNGIKQEGQQWGQEHGLEIDPYNTGQMTLIKGAEVLRYTGDAIGGLLLVEPIFNPKDTIAYTFTSAYNSNGRQGNLNFSAEKKLNSRLGLRIQASAKKAGNFKTPHYYLNNSGFEEENTSFNMRWQINPKHTLVVFMSIYNNKPAILATSHIGNLTDLQRIINENYVPEKGLFTYKINRPYQRIFHQLNKIKWNYKFSQSLQLEGIYSYQINIRKEFDNHNFDDQKPSLHFKLHTQQLDFHITKSIHNHWVYKTGINAYLQTNEYIGRYFIPNYKRHEIFHFGLVRYQNKKNEFELGYRVGAIKLNVYKWEKSVIERYTHTYSGISWQMGWLYKFNHDWQSALQIQQVWRTPNISEMYSNGLHHGAASIEYGNTKLTTELAQAGTYALKYQHNKTMLELEFFIKIITNYIYLKPKFPAELTIRGAFPAFEYTQTNALFYGGDLLITQKLPLNLIFTEKANFLNAEDLKNEIFLNGIPPYQLTHALVYEHQTNKLLLNPRIKFSCQNTFRQNRYTQQSDYLKPPPGFTLFDLSIETRFKKRPQLLTFLSIENLLNKDYRSYLNRFRYYSDEIGRNISLGINFNF